MSAIVSVSHTSRFAGFSAFSEADFTSFYKFVIPVLQVSSGTYKPV